MLMYCRVFLTVGSAVQYSFFVFRSEIIIMYVICFTVMLLINSMGMFMTENKTVSLRNGSLCPATCTDIVTASGIKLEWVRELRCLGVLFVPVNLINLKIT